VAPKRSRASARPATRFCDSPALPAFQASICAFHARVASPSANDETAALTQRAAALEERLDFLEARRLQLQNSTDSRHRMLSMLRQLKQEPLAFAEMFSVVLELARNPALLNGIHNAIPEYRRPAKNPFQPSRLSIQISDSYVDAFVPFDFAHNSFFIRLRDWLFEVQALWTTANTASCLRTKFLRRILSPLCGDWLTVESVPAVAAWAKN
jgi:hypothetical protein